MVVPHLCQKMFNMNLIKLTSHLQEEDQVKGHNKKKIIQIQKAGPPIKKQAQIPQSKCKDKKWWWCGRGRVIKNLFYVLHY